MRDPLLALLRSPELARAYSVAKEDIDLVIADGQMTLL